MISPGLPSQPPHFVADMPACTFEKYSSLNTWWASRTARSGPQSHHVSLPSERASRIFPDLRSVGVFLTVSGAPSFAWTCCAGIPLETGGEICASGKGRRARREQGRGGLWHEFDPMRYDHRFERKARLRKHRDVSPYSSVQRAAYKLTDT